MESIAKRLGCLSLGLAVALTVGCSGGASASTGQSGSANGASQAGGGDPDNLGPYPDWIRAIVPPYPNVTTGILMDNNKGYALETHDSPDTVLAWYKSKVSGTWTVNEAEHRNSTTVNGLYIAIVYNDLAKPPITMIQLSKP